MDDLNNLIDGGEAQSSPVDLTDLVQTSVLPENTAPVSAIRNSAATTALLTGNSDSAVDTFHSLMAEGQQGGSQMLNSLSTQNQQANQAKDLTAVYSILADPKVDLATKQGVIKGFSQNDFLKDKSVTLQTNMLSAPSKGETEDSENARISVADELSKMYSSRYQIQNMVNDTIAKFPDRTVLGAFADAFSNQTILGKSVVAGKVEGAINPNRSVLDVFKTFLTPETTIQNLRDKLDQLPTEQKLVYAQQLIGAIKNNSSFLFGNDNQANAYDMLQVLLQDGHSHLGEFASNAITAAGFIGLGPVAKEIGGVASAVGKAIEGRGAAAITKAEPTVGNLKLQAGGRPEPVLEGTKIVPPTPPANEIVKPATPAILGGSGQKTVQVETKKTAALLTTQRKVEVEAAVARPHPASPGEIANQSNPEQAKNMYDIATKTSDPRPAQAFYNNTADQVVLNEKAGQVAGPGEGVTTKVSGIDDVARVADQPADAERIINIAYDSGGDWFSPLERANVVANVSNDFHNARGLTPVDGMSSIKLEGGTLHVNTVYESPSGSWSNPTDAIEQVKYALRDQGIVDADIELLKKDGLNHTPVEYSADLPQGDYKVRVNVKRVADNNDITSWDSFDVKRNYFDRNPNLVSTDKASVNGWMIEAANQLHPTITGSAANVDYQAARLDKALIGQLKESTDILNKLPANRYAKVENYLKEANYNQIDFNTVDLASQGFTSQEIAGIKKFRDFWDTHHFLANRDQALTLRNQGFKVFENANDKFFAKPIGKNGSIATFYDPSQQLVRSFNPGELDSLYQSGGTLAQFRRPVSINGQTVEHMISRESPTEYLRGLRDTDKVLNKRKGYFQLTYKDAHFVDQVKLDSNGRVVERKAVAVAGDLPTAERFRNRVSSGSTDSFVVRRDVRGLSQTGDDAWDLNSAMGRIEQRHRGKLLEDASAPNQLGGNSFVESPVASAIRSANSIANRTVSRPMIEATKERFLQQYGHVIQSEDKFGKLKYPNDISEIGSVGQESTKEIGDARTTWMYIRKLEQGYVNTIDQATKAWINQFADLLGSKGFGTLERGARAVADTGPTRLARKATSDLYISLNPLRQWVIQSWQTVRMFSYNPVGAFSGRLTLLVGDWTKSKIPGFTGTNQKFLNFVDESGLIESVDRNIMVNGGMQQIADSQSKWVKAGRAAYTPVEWARRVGFDLGETYNRLGHLAAVFDRYERLGKNLNDRFVRANAYSEASALMGDMTRSGEMPYNSSTAGALFQFVQAPHKILFQSMNRRISGTDRIKMAAGDMMMFGVAPVGAIAGYLGIDHLTGDNKDLRDFLDHGLTSLVANHILNEIWEDSGNIDFSSLDVRGVDGMWKMAKAYWSGGMAAAITASPAGGLIGGNRTQTAMKSVARFFNPNPEYDQGNPTTFLGMMNDVASLTSGWSNANKTKLILQQQNRADAYGHLIDKNATTPQAIAQAFGFGSEDQKTLFELSTELSATSKAHKDEVTSNLKSIMQYYQSEIGKGNTNIDWITGVTGAALNIYADDPDAQQIINQQLGYALTESGDALTKQILQVCGLPDPGAIHDAITRAPGVTEENKQKLHQICTDLQNVRETIKARKGK